MNWDLATLMNWDQAMLGQALCCQAGPDDSRQVNDNQDDSQTVLVESAESESVNDQFCFGSRLVSRLPAQALAPDSHRRGVVRVGPLTSSNQSLPSPSLPSPLSISLSPLRLPPPHSPLGSPPLRSPQGSFKQGYRTCGSKWEIYGSEKPAWCCHQLSNEKLVEALQHKVDCKDTDFEFSVHEMEELDIGRNLSYSCYVQVY